jgi:hypothetical protein
MTDEKKDAKGDKRHDDAAQTAGEQEEEKITAQFPQIDFTTFIVSLNTSALVHLGIMEDPGSKQKAKNLMLAKQTIDILAMLEEKTSGNLASEEAGILKSILYDLRILYVKEKK